MNFFSMFRYIETILNTLKYPHYEIIPYLISKLYKVQIQQINPRQYTRVYIQSV